MCSAKGATNRRIAIISAAGRVFHAQGYAATTMDAIAAQAGVAKGSIYNYFRSKQDLFSQLFSEVVEADEAETEQLVAEAIPADEKLQKMVDNVFAQLENYTAIGALVLEFWATAARQKHRGELAKMLEQLFSRWRGWIAAIISQGIKSGRFRQDIDPEIAASLIMAVVDGIIVQSIMEVGVSFGPESHYLDALKRGLLVALTAWAEPPSRRFPQWDPKDQSPENKL